MTVPGRTAPARRSLMLGAGFAVAVGIRVAVGGPGVSQDPLAGLVFAACLTALTLAAGTRLRLAPTAAARAVLLGAAAAAVLCLPVWLARGDRPLTAPGGFLRWAAVVALVALAEEAFLRGALYDAVSAWAGAPAAIGAGAVAFALLHVPLYGWPAVPMDLAVGWLLGELRRITGTPLAPGVAHVLADLGAWFLR